MPSLYILHQLFSSSNDQATTPSTQIHLQDYNTSVLELVTLPNVLLTWYASPLSIPYRSSMNDSEIAPTLDITSPGELPITRKLKTAFISSLVALNITIRFFSGSWNTFNPTGTIGSDRYNMILTSETIYQMDSLESLVDLMQAACIGEKKGIAERCDLFFPNYSCRGEHLWSFMSLSVLGGGQSSLFWSGRWSIGVLKMHRTTKGGCHDCPRTQSRCGQKSNTCGMGPMNNVVGAV